MKTWAIVLFALFATWTLPVVPAAHARGADDDIIMEEDDTSKPAEEKPADGDLPADTDPGAKDPGATDPGTTDPATTDAAAAVAGDDKDTKTKGDDEDARSYWSDIKVVPRKLILKQNRIELIPYMGVTLNDNLIRHIALGGEFGYYMSDAMSIGVGGHMYMKQQTDRAYLTGLQQQEDPAVGNLPFGWSRRHRHRGHSPQRGPRALDQHEHHDSGRRGLPCVHQSMADPLGRRPQLHDAGQVRELQSYAARGGRR